SADVTGIEARLIPRGAISGRLVLAEGSTACQSQQPRRLMDASVIARREGADLPASEQYRPNQKGEFAIRGMEAGRYRFAVWLPTNSWYLRAVTISGSEPTQRPRDAARDGLTIRPGERVTGLMVTLAEGASFLGGTVIPGVEGAPLPSRLRVY